MKVYASPNSTYQTVVADGVDYQPAAGEVLMITTRPEGAHQATADGTWVTAAAPEPVTVGALFTILPVNDGNPVSVASQHILVNPFPGYHVQCQVEVCVGTEWGVLSTSQFHFANQTGVNQYKGSGAFCAQHDDELVLVIGNGHLEDGGTNESYYCHVFFYTFTENKTYPSGQSYDSLPCRIRVWRVGKR